MIRREPTMIALSDLDVQDIKDMMVKAEAEAQAIAADNGIPPTPKPKPKDPAAPLSIDGVLNRRRRDRNGMR